MNRVIEEIVDVDELAPYANEWQALANRGEGVEFFQTYEWVTTWLECFWQNRPICFLFVREGGNLVGVLPLLDDLHGEVAHCSRALALPVNSNANRSDLLHEGGAEELLDVIVAHLKHSRGSLRLWGTLRNDSPLVQIAQRLCQRHALHLFVSQAPPCPVIHFNSDWSGYLASLSRRTRHEMQRKRRRLEREGKVEFRVLNGLADCNEGLQQVSNIEAASWKQVEGTSFTADLTVGRFYADLARRAAARGWLRIYLLLFNEQPIAHIFGVAFKGEYYAFKTSYHSSFSAFSPGSVLFLHALQDSCEHGIKMFDLLGTQSRWKGQIATNQRDHAILCIYSKSAYNCHWRKPIEVHLIPWVRKHRQRLKPWVIKHAPALLSLYQELQKRLVRK